MQPLILLLLLLPRKRKRRDPILIEEERGRTSLLDESTTRRPSSRCPLRTSVESESRKGSLEPLAFGWKATEEDA